MTSAPPPRPVPPHHAPPAPEMPEPAPHMPSPYQPPQPISYIPPGMPASPVVPGPPPALAGSGCGRGCLYTLLGGMGCMGLLVALLIGALVVAGQSLDGFLRGATQLFTPGAINITGVFVPTVERLQRLAQLTTIRFNYANIVTAQTEMPPLIAALYGENQVLVAVGHIEAGMDLGRLRPEDIAYDATTGTITIALPAPQLTNCFLNEQQTYVAQRASGIFAAPSPNLDVESRRFAVQQFRLKALEEGILEEAQAHTETTLREFILLFNEATLTVQFRSTPPDPNAALPTTCQ